MTRQDFIDDITSWYELIDFCNDENCDVCSDIVDDDYKDEYVNDHLVDWARNNTWRELLSILDDIPDGYDFYRIDGYGEIEGLDNYSDFEEYKDNVLDWMDYMERWDDDEEEEVEEEPAPIEEVIEEDDLDMSEPFEIFSLMGTSKEIIKAADEAREAAEAEEEAELIALVQTA